MHWRAKTSSSLIVHRQLSHFDGVLLPPVSLPSVSLPILVSSDDRAWLSFASTNKGLAELRVWEGGKTKWFAHKNPAPAQNAAGTCCARSCYTGTTVPELKMDRENGGHLAAHRAAWADCDKLPSCVRAVRAPPVQAQTNFATIELHNTAIL